MTRQKKRHQVEQAREFYANQVCNYVSWLTRYIFQIQSYGIKNS